MSDPMKTRGLSERMMACNVENALHGSAGEIPAIAPPFHSRTEETSDAL